MGSLATSSMFSSAAETKTRSPRRASCHSMTRTLMRQGLKRDIWAAQPCLFSWASRTLVQLAKSLAACWSQASQARAGSF